MAFCSSCGAQLPEEARFCPACGATVAGGAVPNAPPPSPVAEPVHPAHTASVPAATGGSGARLILPIVVLIAAAVIAFLLWSQRDGTRPIAGRDPAGPAERTATADEAARPEAARDMAAGIDTATATTAAALDSAFFGDPASAAARYDGPLRVSGTIATMVTPGPTPALSLEGRSRFNYVIVNFPDGYRQALAPLAKGQRIAVTCERVSALGGTTILHGCTLAE